MKELLKKLGSMDAGMLCIPALMLLGYIFIHMLFGGTLLSYNCWDSYSLQAMSWLSGRLDMGKNYEWLELAVYNGKYYLSASAQRCDAAARAAFRREDAQQSGIRALRHIYRHDRL